MAAAGGGSAKTVDLPPTVSVEWLAGRLGDAAVVVLDATWFLPTWGRDAIGEHRSVRIPGSKFFDIDGVADTSNPLPHMMPSEVQFASACDALGIGPDDTVVVYDALGVFSSPRAWWMFKSFGHPRVAVLDGGLPAWKAAGLALDDSEAALEATVVATTAAADAAGESKYPAKLRPGAVADLKQVLGIVADRSMPMVDARPAGRFHGTAPEPRPGLPSGHMPGSISLPFLDVLEDGLGSKIACGEKLAEVFNAADLDLSEPLLCSCGTGVTASIVALAMEMCGAEDVVIYDGSWSEYAAIDITPKAEEAHPEA